MDAMTATGAATSTGTSSASSGTATNASPNPNVERMRVARKRTAGTRRVVEPAVMLSSVSRNRVGAGHALGHARLVVTSHSVRRPPRLARHRRVGFRTSGTSVRSIGAALQSNHDSPIYLLL